MAEAAANQGTEIPGEVAPGEIQDLGVDETPAAPAGSSEVELEAIAKGWKPEAEFDGPKGAWIDAKEFLQREPLFDRIKSQSKELKGLKKTIEAMTSQFQTQVNAQVQLRLSELKAAKKEAIEAGDVAQVDKIDTEIESTKLSVKQDVPQIPDEVSEWIDKNPWFKTDKELNAFAIAHNRTYIENHPGDVLGSLEATAKAVRKAFPEKFETTPKAAPSPVASAQPKDADGGGKYNMARLSDDQKLVYNQMVKRNGILSHDEFFKGLEEIGELS